MIQTPTASSSPDAAPSSFRLCGCLTDVSAGDIPKFLKETPGVDLLEWRLDLFLEHHSVAETTQALAHLATRPRLSVLATLRPTAEGGAFAGPEELRLRLLREAVDAGADWVDLEASVPPSVVADFAATSAGVLLSHHDFNATPPEEELKRLARSMSALLDGRPGILKIVTTACAPEDNLRVLSLIPWARDVLRHPVIAFCMGPLGRWSRAVSLLLGSPWTYVQLPGQAAPAPGPFTPDEIRSILESLR